MGDTRWPADVEADFYFRARRVVAGIEKHCFLEQSTAVNISGRLRVICFSALFLFLVFPTCRTSIDKLAEEWPVSVGELGKIKEMVISKMKKEAVDH